jgi:hypothetical protein
LPTQTYLNGDESPTKENLLKSWLQTFVAGTFMVFALRQSRRHDHYRTAGHDVRRRHGLRLG